MDTVQRIVDGKIDFQGQRLSDRIYQEIIIFSAGLGLFLGYVMQNMQICLGIFTASLVVALVVCVPPWPMFNRHHVDWLPKRPKDGQEVEREGDKKVERAS